MRIGIYGGTFNPPHIGHVRSAKSAERQLALDLLIVVPAGIPPHKPLPDGTPPADMRLHMARLAFTDAIVSGIESVNAGPGYTADTIKSIKNDFKNAELFLLIGTDMYLTLESWKDSEFIFQTVTPAVFSRGSGDMRRITAYSSVLYEKYGVNTAVIDNSVIEISSSMLREMLPRREGIGYINDTIYPYIIKNRLYGAKPDWNWLRERAYSMLDATRIPHVAGCESAALRLAKQWGVDADDAREAAILHDITKRLGVEDNLRILSAHGIAAGKIEYAEEKLFHSKTGAILAQAEFGASDAVADAIMWHTTGRAGMSSLEKVIYLADYIEPTRDFDGVALLRELAFKNLDSAVRMGLEMSITDMRERGIKPNRITFDALNDLAI